MSTAAVFLAPRHEAAFLSWTTSYVIELFAGHPNRSLSLTNQLLYLGQSKGCGDAMLLELESDLWCLGCLHGVSTRPAKQER